MGYGVDADIENLLNLMGIGFTRGDRGLLTLTRKEDQEEMQATELMAHMSIGVHGPTSVLLAACRMAQRRGLLDCNKPEEVLTPYGCWALYWALGRVGEPDYLKAMDVSHGVGEDGYPILLKSYPEVEMPTY